MGDPTPARPARKLMLAPFCERRPIAAACARQDRCCLTGGIIDTTGKVDEQFNRQKEGSIDMLAKNAARYGQLIVQPTLAQVHHRPSILVKHRRRHDVCQHNAMIARLDVRDWPAFEIAERAGQHRQPCR